MTPWHPLLRGLYVITDPALTPAERLLLQVEAALKGGATVVQYRDKTSSPEEKLSHAKALRALCSDYQRTLIINDDIELCHQVGADGVHLGQTDTTVAAARQRLGYTAFIGATCHNSVSLAHQAVKDGASYVAFGRFFSSQTKPDAPPANLCDLAAAIPTLPVPAVAIGGITLERAPTLLAAGFAMLAVIQDVFARADTEAHCARYRTLFNSAPFHQRLAH